MGFLFCSERGPPERNVKEDGQDSPTFHMSQNLGLRNRVDAEQRLDQTLAEQEAHLASEGHKRVQRVSLIAHSC